MNKVSFKSGVKFFKGLKKYVDEMRQAPARYSKRVMDFLRGKSKILDRYTPLSKENFGTLKSVIKRRLIRPASWNFTKRTPIPNIKYTYHRSIPNTKEDLRRFVQLRRKVIKDAQHYFSNHKVSVDDVLGYHRSIIRNKVRKSREIVKLPQHLKKDISIHDVVKFKHRYKTYSAQRFLVKYSNYMNVKNLLNMRKPVRKAQVKSFGILKMKKHVKGSLNYVQTL